MSHNILVGVDNGTECNSIHEAANDKIKNVYIFTFVVWQNVLLYNKQSLLWFNSHLFYGGSCDDWGGVIQEAS